MTRIKNCIKMPQFAKIKLFELELCIRKKNAKNPNKLLNKKKKSYKNDLRTVLSRLKSIFKQAFTFAKPFRLHYLLLHSNKLHYLLLHNKMHR